MKIFKLVSVDELSGRLYSWSELDKKVRVLYTPDKWAHPQVKGTPLFAFDNEADVLRWCGGNLSFSSQLWEAESDIAKSFEPLLFGLSQFGRVNNWKRKWKNWRKSKIHSWKGVVLCGKIKLLRRIK